MGNKYEKKWLNIESAINVCHSGRSIGQYICILIILTYLYLKTTLETHTNGR